MKGGTESPETDRGQDRGQPIGLDIGTSRIVVARGVGRKQTCQAELNAFITLPYSELTHSLLNRENVFYDIHGSEFLVFGDDAQKFAEIFHVETRRPMLHGVLNSNEPHSLMVLSRIIQKLIGRADASNQRICFSLPAPAMGTEKSVTYHELLCRQMLTELGYDPKPISEGLAVVFGELASSNYTGIAISCGSGLCNICLAVLSLPVTAFSIPKAGDFIDSQAALATGELATRLRVQKERSFQLNGYAADRVQNVLTVYYEDMIVTLVASLREALSSTLRLPKFDQSIPLVLCGGTAMPKGFVERFDRTLRNEDFPIQLSEIRLSPDPLTSTARGALVAALQESPQVKLAASA
ncbi:MAG TPA: hypothetical protein VKR43_09495 [Bryobacteraceae bacterium]|nr:hypothetical protein [Bryobacteraceae bacterium]